MSNPLFTFRPTKDKLQPFEKRFSKRETTVRKWTFVRDSESVSETNVRRDSLRSNASTRLSSASLSNLKRKSSIPAILEGVNLPSGTPEGSENGSDLNSDLSPYSQASDILTHASLRSRTKQKVQVDSDNNVSSSSEVKTTGSDQGTITSTLDSTKESSTENIRRSPRKKPKQVNTEAISGISRKIPKRDEDLQTVRNSTVLHVDEVSSDSTLYSQTKEETHRRSPRKRPFQSVLNSSVNNNSVMSTKISSAKMMDVDILEKSVRIELERIETADELEGENVVQNDKKVERGLASCKKLKSSYNEQALSRSTNIDDGRRSARLHKVSPINSDEDSPQKSVRSSRLQKDSSMNSDEGSPQKSERNSRLQKDSPMNSDEDSPQKSVRSSRLESIDSQGQKPDINEKRRSSRLSKLDHENIDKDTLYSTSSKEMVKRPTKETTANNENEIDNEEISGENYIEDNEEISRENYIEDNEEISGDDVIENNETSSRFKLNNVSGQKHVSTAVNPVNISYGENWNEGQLKNDDSESDKISKNNSKSINMISVDDRRKYLKNNSKSINSDISRRQVSTEESEDLTEDQHIFSASMEETNGYKSKEDIFRTGSSDEISTDSELRKNAEPNQQTEKQNVSRLSLKSQLHTNIGHQESKSTGTSFQNQQKGNENNSTLSRSSRSNEENQLGLSQKKNSSCQEDVVSMETEIDRNEQQMKPNLVNDHETNKEKEIEQEEKESSHCTEDDLVAKIKEVSSNIEQRSNNHGDHPGEIESSHHTEGNLVATDNEEVSGNKKQRSNNHGDHPGEIESSHHTEDNLVATDNEEVSGNEKQRSYNHGDHPREIESILVHVSSEIPAGKKSVNAVKKKVRIVADETESFNEALSRSTNIDDGRRSARLHKVSHMFNSDEDSPQKSVRSSRLQKDSSMNSDEGSPQKSERNSRLQKDSPMNSDEDSPQKSVRSSSLESIDSQGQKPDLNEKRRSSRLSKLDHENIDKDTLYSTSSKEMVKRPTKETTASREKIGLKKIKTSSENVIEEKEKKLRDNEIEANEEISNDNEIEDNEEISGENNIEDNEEISRENYIEDNEEISGDDVIENNETSSRFKLNNVSGQKHVSTAVNPVNISYGENWNEGQLKNGDSESVKISKNNSKSINSDINRQQEKISKNNSKSINSDISRQQEKISKNNSKSINSDISRRQVSTEESEDLTEDQHIFSASMEETNGYKSKEDIFRTGSSDEMSTDSEERKKAEPNKKQKNKMHQDYPSRANFIQTLDTKRVNQMELVSKISKREMKIIQHCLEVQEDVVSMETEIDRNEHQMKPNLVNDHETKEGEEIEQEEKEWSHCTEDDLVATDNEEVSSNIEQRSNNHGDHPGEIESSHHTEDNLVATDNEEVSVHVSSDTPARKKSVNAVKKKVRIVADEPESFNEERTVRMWKGNDRTRTKGDLIDLDIVLETINNTIEERRSGCSDSLGKKALNSLLVYTRKEITDTINKIEDLKHDKKDLSRSRKDVKMLREKLLQLQMDRTSLMKKVKAKKQTIKPKLNDISQWLTSMTRLMKVTPKTKSPRKVVYTTYGNFPFNV
ncbi:unnamed protein product [Mytilus edulis]|uniref:Uncharacterized protein n=1 Tax=Mytilus edulis TaxID=6550 RepID=A0A8S3ULK0_MYTED|nr:unnamed protein product [Mytilus edulis]